MNSSRHQRWILTLVLTLFGIGLAVVPAFTPHSPVAAQSSTATATGTVMATGTVTGTSTAVATGTVTLTATAAASPTTVPTSPPVSGPGVFVLCGPVGTFTAPTSAAAGSLVIGGISIPVAAGTTIAGSTLLTAGTFVCVQFSMNPTGQIVAASVFASTGTTPIVNVCGAVSSFTAATSSAAGTITIAGLTLPIATATTLTGPTMTVGGTVCLQATLNSSGQIVSGTVSVPLAATPYDSSGDGFVRVGHEFAG